MKRREFIAATAALLVSPRRSWAQGTPRQIGFLGGTKLTWRERPKLSFCFRGGEWKLDSGPGSN